VFIVIPAFVSESILRRTRVAPLVSVTTVAVTSALPSRLEERIAEHPATLGGVCRDRSKADPHTPIRSLYTHEAAPTGGAVSLDLTFRLIFLAAASIRVSPDRSSPHRGGSTLS
jgi:hypothetical protein